MRNKAAPHPAESLPSRAEVAVENNLASLNEHAHRDVLSLQRTPILVHSHLRWDFVWQRPQQILSRLAEHHPIAFVEEPQQRDGPAALDIDTLHANIHRIVPRLPHPDMPIDALVDVLQPLFEQARRTHPALAGRFDGPLIHWLYTPMPVRALDWFGDSTVVYDCMDELANFLFAPPDIKEREARLLRRADVVFTGGWQLYEAKAKHHANVHFYGCGVDALHFGRAQDATLQLPDEVAGLPRPIFGYFGVIDERLDYDLLRALASDDPGASLVMVGPVVKIDEGQLPRAPNIHWLGPKPYAELPALAKSFDVCLMPFALNDATRYINPTKTLEYMAAGKPIVSTAVPDVVRNFSAVVDVAFSHEEFIQAVNNAVNRPDEQRLSAGIARARNASWDAIVASMRHDISISQRRSTLSVVRAQPKETVR